jgi:hypothetical protein
MNNMEDKKLLENLIFKAGFVRYGEIKRIGDFSDFDGMVQNIKETESVLGPLVVAIEVRERSVPDSKGSFSCQVIYRGAFTAADVKKRILDCYKKYRCKNEKKLADLYIERIMSCLASIYGYGIQENPVVIISPDIQEILKNAEKINEKFRDSKIAMICGCEVKIVPGKNILYVGFDANKEDL